MNPNPFKKDFLPLGFGCAWLSGGRNEARSRELLETAYDAGIRYFDVARMYMSGEAEGVLGTFMGSKRQDLIVTSKAGIMPPTENPHYRRWKRRFLKLSHLVLRTPKPKDDYFRFGMFDTKSLRRSVETSLRQLRTDRLDALLLHEVDLHHMRDGSVLRFLEDLRSAGTIGCYGIASTREQTQQLLPEFGSRMAIVQTASTILADGLTPLANRGRFLTITHSIFAEALGKIAARLESDDAFRRQWQQRTGTDASRESVAGLLLAEALDANRDGVVLFSSSSPARIRSAARIAQERPYGADQLAAARALAQSMAD